ncbi:MULTISPECIES: cysteine hydrolase [unclassified Flammeovirga]|uniref:cysteine hydrolase n=1 Tax=unclassified Flammeovirga TaxID=2637820 RepID=UPI0005C5BD6E|nr:MULTISPECIES: cysteine hydrolase [unclassified Flammeovirga]MBD0400003.1 cysteine hydrolase [Flammeovirga sp. EKP202]
MDYKQTAVVLIEFQNDFATPGGVFHEAVKTVMHQTDMLSNTQAVIKAARAKGAEIIYVPISFSSDYRELTQTPYGILKGVVDNNAFLKDEWGSQLIDFLSPQPEDIIIEGKKGLDTFCSTNLDFILRSKGIQNVVLAGFLTNCCVESTMRTAYEKGFNVITLTDCCAATSVEEHENAVKHDFPMFSQPLSAEEFIDSLEEGKEIALVGRGYE